MSFIEFQNIQKSFGSKKVLEDVSFAVNKGETLTILGGSGTGKTLLLKIFIGLMQPSTGKVLWENQNLTTLTEDEWHKVRRRIGMLFQGGALFDSLSVKENIAYPLREHFDYKESKIDQIVVQKLKCVGLEGIQDMMPSDLSGGMKKRVALARAIATDPEVILYDEPTTGLDPANTNRIDHLIRDLQKQFQVTSLVVTHDIRSAFFVSDRLALLDHGKIRFIGTRQQMESADDPVVKAFLKGEGE